MTDGDAELLAVEVAKFRLAVDVGDEPWDWKTAFIDAQPFHAVGHLKGSNFFVQLGHPAFSTDTARGVRLICSTLQSCRRHQTCRPCSVHPTSRRDHFCGVMQSGRSRWQAAQYMLASICRPFSMIARCSLMNWLAHLVDTGLLHLFGALRTIGSL